MIGDQFHVRNDTISIWHHLSSAIKLAGANLIILFLVGLPAQLHADDLADCNSNDAELIIAGCSAVIDEGEILGADLAVVFSLRSDAYVVQNRFSEAIAGWEAALELQPANEEYTNRLLDAHERRGDQHLVSGALQEAIDDYTIVVDGAFESIQLLEKRSEAYWGLGDIESAIGDLERALALSSYDNMIAERIALLHELEAARALEVGDLSQAVSSYQSAYGHLATIDLECPPDGTREASPESTVCASKVRVASGASRVFLERARIQLGDGRVGAAITDFNFALSIDPSNVSARILYALANEQLGDFDSARTAYDQILASDPNNQEAQEGLSRLNQRDRNLVRTLQIELQRVGCDPGPIDGLWGPMTRAALERFNLQTGRGLNTTEPSRSASIAVSDYESHTCPDFTPFFISALGIEVRTADDGRGVLVTRVQSDSRAARAGVERGMIFQEISTISPLGFSRTNTPRELEERVLSILSGSEGDRRMLAVVSGGSIFIYP